MTGSLYDWNIVKPETRNQNGDTVALRMLTLFKGLNVHYLTHITGLVFIVLLLTGLFMLHTEAQHARQHSAHMKIIMQIYHYIGQLSVDAAPQRIDEVGLSYTKWQESLNQLSHHARLLQRGGQFLGSEIKPVIELLPADVFDSFDQPWQVTKINLQSALANRDLLIAMVELKIHIFAIHHRLQNKLQSLSVKLAQAGWNADQIGTIDTISTLASAMAAAIPLTSAVDFDHMDRTNPLNTSFSRLATMRDKLKESIELLRVSTANNLLDQPIPANMTLHIESALNDAAELLQLSNKITPDAAGTWQHFQASLTASRQMVEPFSHIEQGVTAYFQDLQTRQTILILASLILAAIAAFLFIYSFSNNLRKKLLRGKHDVEHTQQAILRLLNEMEKPANGDLTARMSVTENMTGTIADAINLTIEELQALVKKVDYASTHVINTSTQAEKISSGLLTVAQAQSQKIEESTITVLSIAESLETVSRSANACAEVSKQSLKAAESGAHAVQDAINGMNEIRTYIQETAKRIKRLGESSQEIGEIVTLISDITEQTNVLALNAAIQAASAGEAGKGFSVIAQEIQRLAEHSAEATKQISTLVRNIRGDTQDTIIAMERSTTGVVEGTRRANATGDALEEIETVSKQLAQLVAEISAATRSQTLVTSKIAKSMEDILAITRQTTEGTASNADSIKRIADHATRLKASISRFKV
ncbi:MAG TPA: methyl-accepting chemotaxis protein [Nitrosomonas mobilis]|nr:methyl-accepting chemotaxis protein [Nitrosomonas mobilis]